jgi:hypothetical protein
MNNTPLSFIRLTLFAVFTQSVLFGAESPDDILVAPWTKTLLVLVFTFGVAAVIGFLIDAQHKARKKDSQPGVDAYIDQIIMGNGTRLPRADR